MLTKGIFVQVDSWVDTALALFLWDKFRFNNGLALISMFSPSLLQMQIMRGGKDGIST
jgi:hypothetical protein